ncbi:MAG: Peptidase A24A prepilin type IV [Desulfotomaculum sp. 46_296]|nr:MAG: Peptidase A24A prepilin type IV [Desulfotomaculum sp. 46_296]HAU32096.1 prepilin peptidase [Desulfotomaculum sp.]
METCLDIVVIIIVGIASLMDLKTRRIPNWLTFSAAASGLIACYQLLGWPGLYFGAKGLVMGILVFLIPFLFGGMGGGDVKLMGAIGAFKGVHFILITAILAAVWGGILALAALFWKRKRAVLKRFLLGLKLYFLTSGQAGKDLLLPENNSVNRQNIYIPYGLAIFLGLISSYLIGW